MKTIYKCQKCNAVDSDKGENPPAPRDLNCWKCHGQATMLPVDRVATEQVSKEQVR